MIAAIAVQTGISPDVIADMDFEYGYAMLDLFKRQSDAVTKSTAASRGSTKSLTPSEEQYKRRKEMWKK